MTKAVLGIGVFVLIASLAPAHAQAPQAPAMMAGSLEEARRAIDKGNAQWSEAWAKRDSSMIASLFADDGVLLLGNGKMIKGPAQIAERQKTAMMGADPGVKVTVTTMNVWLDGDTAYESGRYKYEYTEKGKPGVDEGRYITAWRHQKDGGWKLVMDVGFPKE